MIEQPIREFEDTQDAVDQALWEYSPVRGSLWELEAVVVEPGVVEVSGHVRAWTIHDGVIESLRAVPGLQRIVDRLVVDPQLETEVARALADVRELPVGAVVVRSHLGVVSLLGDLPKESLREAVLQTARSVSGVRRVEDRLQVES